MKSHIIFRCCTGSVFVAVIFFCFTSCVFHKAPLYTQELKSIRNQAEGQLEIDVDAFNNYVDRPLSDGPFNAKNNLEFLRENIPLFISSDKNFSRVYNYRWWMISKHLKQYQDPSDQKEYWVITEFFGDRPWATLSGAITCPVGHQFYDVRWLRDPKYLKSYADYFMTGSASYLMQRQNGNFLTYKERPESHHFSSWMIDGIESFLKVHPDRDWQRQILPSLERHQQVWDSLFTVKAPGAKTDGLYKILDLYDGMEFSLSAVLGLIESRTGAYALYTEDSWKQYYLGWGTTDAVSKSSYAKAFPRAFRKGYPDLYLARPSINSYAYGNLQSLANLYSLQGDDEYSKMKSLSYRKRTLELQEKILSTLWNQQDQFFYTSTAGDNQFGIGDFQAKVRESVGYTPWYFNAIPKDQASKYEKAWEMFASPSGFFNASGMTTAERKHPYYNEQAYAWNGRGWPFQNSVVYKSYANYLRNYKQGVSENDRKLLFAHIEQLVQLHGQQELNIGEWYIPSNGVSFGGEKDYFHSTFPDILIEDLIGFKAVHEDEFILEPLLPAQVWEHFYLGNISYHGHTVDIIWKKDWEVKREGDQSRLCIFVDGKLVKQARNLTEKVVVQLSRK